MHVKVIYKAVSQSVSHSANIVFRMKFLALSNNFVCVVVGRAAIIVHKCTQIQNQLLPPERISMKFNENEYQHFCMYYISCAQYTYNMNLLYMHHKLQFHSEYYT